MSISSGDINMLLKTPSRSSTMLGGSRLMKNFKPTGYVNKKFRGGDDPAAPATEAAPAGETPAEATPAGETQKQLTPEEQQEITAEQQEIKEAEKQAEIADKKGGFMDKIKASWNRFIIWFKNFFGIGKKKEAAAPAGETQEQMTGGGIIGDIGLIIVKFILIFLIAICVIIIIEEIVNILKKVDFNKIFKGLPLSECGKTSCKCSKKSKKDKRKRQLIIAPVPCSEYVNSIGNKIKKQNQIIQNEPKMQAAEPEPIADIQQGIKEQNLLQESSMINPLNSALRDDDLFKDRLELQGVRNIPVNTRDFL